MNIRILLLLPLLLGVSVNGWTVPAKCDGGSTLPGCKSGDNGDSQPTFSVHMQAGVVGDVVVDDLVVACKEVVYVDDVAVVEPVVITTTDPDCSGTTTQPKLSVNFPVNCGGVMVDNQVHYLFAIAVKNTKKETSAMLFFTTAANAVPPPNDTVFSTGRLDAELIELTNGETAFQIEVDEEGVGLTKLHQPGKGDVSIGKICVGHIVYTEL